MKNCHLFFNSITMKTRSEINSNSAKEEGGKTMAMNRREFLKISATGIATIVVGSHFPFLGVKNAFAATQILEVTITDALKDMVTHNSVNTAQCYFWVYKMKADGVDIPVECPGPSIYAVQGDTITISITNTLDEAHSFFIPGVFDSGPIAPG